MSQITETVDVDVPISVAYDQWTQFETFPQFMEGVESVTQVDDTRNRWKVEVAGATREFDTEIRRSASRGPRWAVTSSRPES